jgi:hypothetical protein
MSVSFSPQVQSYLDLVLIPLRFSCTTKSGWPTVLSLWYVRIENSLYCATQASARVVSYIQNNPRCAYEIAADQPPYCGIRGQGMAYLEPARGREILELLIERYLGNRDLPLSKKLLARAEQEVAINIETSSLYQWDFRQRMQSSLTEIEPKPCPSRAQQVGKVDRTQ